MPNKLPETEYSTRVDELRKNRVELGSLKYGPAKKNFGEKLVAAVPTCEQCIQKYKDTGNTEYLIDAMNYLMFEYMYPQKEGAFFKATDSGESAGIVGVSYKDILREAEEGM